MSIKIRLLLVLVVLLNLACVASKDTTPGSRAVTNEVKNLNNEVVFQDWRKRCRFVNKKGKVCMIYQDRISRDSGKSLLFASFSFNGEEEKLVASFRVPVDVFSPSGIAVKIDEEKQVNFVIQTCLTDGCYAYVNIRDNLLKQFKNGLQAKVGFMSIEKKQMAVNLSLKGFDLAINSLRK